MELVIKNMVCPRCIIMVEKTLAAMRLDVENVLLGRVILRQVLSPAVYEELEHKLASSGFSILSERNEILVEKVKNCVISVIHSESRIGISENFSTLIREATGADYNATSVIFSATEGLTIEKYIILQRIERAKELLMYDELSLAEIARLLGYSSPQHLSAQFRKVTGMTATVFRKDGRALRFALDSL